MQKLLKLTRLYSKFHWKQFSDYFKQKLALGLICNKLKRRKGAATVSHLGAEQHRATISPLCVPEPCAGSHIDCQ